MASTPTPGRFRTRVITGGVVPSLHIDYKHSKIKQYHKLGRAIRTETTINDANADFGIPKRLTSLPDLRQIGFTANRRLLGADISHDPIRGAQAFTALTAPLSPPTTVSPDSARRPPGPRPPAGPAHPPATAPRIHQPRAAHPDRASPRHHLRGHHRRENNLRPAPPARTRTHPAHPATRRYQVTDTGLHQPCSSPAPTTTSSAPAWPSSTTPARPPPPRSEPPPACTRPPSTTSPAKHTSPHDTCQHKQQTTRQPQLTQYCRLRRLSRANRGRGVGGFRREWCGRVGLRGRAGSRRL